MNAGREIVSPFHCFSASRFLYVLLLRHGRADGYNPGIPIHPSGLVSLRYVLSILPTWTTGDRKLWADWPQQYHIMLKTDKSMIKNGIRFLEPAASE